MMDATNAPLTTTHQRPASGLATPDAPFPPAAPSRAAGWLVYALTLGYLVSLAACWWVLQVLSEEVWWSTPLVYLPRLPLLMPVIALSLASLLWARGALFLNLLSALIVLGPIMEFNLPMTRWLSAADESSGSSQVCVITANTQRFKPDFAELLNEMRQLEPDIVCLQEARGDVKSFFHIFPGWHSVHQDFLFVASRYPVRLVQQLDTQAFDRETGLFVEVDHPDGPIAVVSIHQMTARRALKELSPGGIIQGTDSIELDEFQQRRREEAGELRAQIEQLRGSLPLIICGDFNTPAHSSIQRETWGDLQNAFDCAGFGYGFTSPVRDHSFWPDKTPWARIDHILCSGEWTVLEAAAGSSDGSDHHLMMARLSRSQVPLTTTEPADTPQDEAGSSAAPAIAP